MSQPPSSGKGSEQPPPDLTVQKEDAKPSTTRLASLRPTNPIPSSANSPAPPPATATSSSGFRPFRPMKPSVSPSLAPSLPTSSEASHQLPFSSLTPKSPPLQSRSPRGGSTRGAGRGARGGKMSASATAAVLSNTSVSFSGVRMRSSPARGLADRSKQSSPRDVVAPKARKTFSSASVSSSSSTSTAASPRIFGSKNMTENLGPSVQRFDLIDGDQSGLYPTSMPYIPPPLSIPSGDITAAEYLFPSDSQELMMVQFPGCLPISVPDPSSPGELVPVPIEDLPEGFLGKIQIYESGEAKMIVGNIIFNLSVGVTGSWFQELVAIFPDEQRSFNLGQIPKRLIINPDIEYLMDPTVPVDFVEERMSNQRDR